MTINKQEPSPPLHRVDGAIELHSVFPTIQGEGPFAGHAAIFLRLGGCNLQCPLCDTEYTNDVLLSTLETTLFCIAQHAHTQLVVITGGEPFRQNITPLVEALLRASHKVQVETNGTFYPGDDFPWQDVTVVCSPKTGKIHPKMAQRVSAYKYVLSNDSVASDGLPERVLGHHIAGFKYVARPPVDWEGPVYLQPADSKDPIINAANIRAVAGSVMINKNYIMGVQMNKLTDLP